MRVLLFGSFDLLHKGHENLFKQARKYGDTLFVCLARDSTIKKLKKKPPFFDERERIKNLKKTGLVDKIFLGSKNNFYLPIKKIKPYIICLGYDQTFFIKNLRSKIKEWAMNTKIVRLKSYLPEIYKSSKLRKKYVRH